MSSIHRHESVFFFFFFNVEYTRHVVKKFAFAIKVKFRQNKKCIRNLNTF